jgi:hypothetical protein
MMRIGQEWLRGVAAMAGLANDTTDTPRRRLRRARGAQRLVSALARCASRGSPGGVIARAQGLPQISRLNPHPSQASPGRSELWGWRHR